MEKFIEHPNTIEINLDKKFPYVKENSSLLKFIEKFKETNPELFAVKEIALLITFIIGTLFLLVNYFSLFIFLEYYF
jgi:hypothetical protein